MIVACKQALIATLKAAGLPDQQIFDDPKKAATMKGAVWAEIHWGPEQLQESRTRVARLPTGGYRWLTHHRTVNVTVTLSHRDAGLLANLVASFLAGLPVTIDDGAGNAVRVQARTNLPEEDISALRSQNLAPVQLAFLGGVYQDKPGGTWDTSRVRPAETITIQTGG